MASTGEHPFLQDDFLIRWSELTPDHVETDIDLALDQARQRLDDLAGTDRGQLSFETVLLGLESALEPLEKAWGKVSHLVSVCDSDDLREAHNAMLPKVTEFTTAIYLDEGLWDLLKTYSETSDAASLAGPQRRFLEETLADFREKGAELKGEGRERLAVLEQELAAATQKFSENLLDSTNAWEHVVEDEAEIDGLPATSRQAALEDAIRKGLATEDSPKWRFTLHATSLFPLLEHASSEQLRKLAWEGSNTVGRGGDYDNTDLLFEILRLRSEKAKLLGEANFADLVLKRRMAKDGATAIGFVENLHRKVKESFEREVTELQEYRAESLAVETEPLQPWEVAFWAEKRRKNLYDFDDEEVRPYFPIDGVLKGMFGIAERIFGVEIVEKKTVYIEPGSETPAGHAVQVWHPEVKFYELRDANGVHLGSFYADWHPRESKRGGAWMNFLATGRPPGDDHDREPHLGLICGNMTPASGGKPALLSHDEVTTVFHEFGHLIHHLFGEVEIKSLNGVQVAWDFVELPSQFMENFCWERESLDFFARHFETGEVIPQKLFRKMIAARNYLSASAMMRQLALGKLDLELHLNRSDGPSQDLDALSRKICSGYLAPLKTESPSMGRRFGHLFSSPTGYAAGYYSYKWAEVLDADAFSRFLVEGVLNEETGSSFRREILSRGNSEDPSALFHNFMGREPDLGALLRRSGLTG